VEEIPIEGAMLLLTASVCRETHLLASVQFINTLHG
jgi:hypothetical protein